MRVLFMTLLSAFSLGNKAQIVSELSFNKENKTVTLKLTNEVDQLMFLSPSTGGDPETATYFIISYKDVNGSIIHTFSKLVFENKYITHLLLPKATQYYDLNLNTDKFTNIHFVEVKVHIEVRNSTRKIRFKEELCEVYKWK